MRRSVFHVLLAMLVVAWAGCGGSGGDSATTEPPPAALGADGGKVDVPGIATVVVPPGVLDAQTTIRVAQDSSAAPPVPAWFRPAGPMVAITPHGGSFAEPVTVRLPAPSVTLQPNERLLLAKAQPGGEWEVYADTVLKDGQLEVQVHAFSTFVPVVVPFTTTPLSPPPFSLSSPTLTCAGRPCEAIERVGPMPMTASTSGNGGVFPTHCVNPRVHLRRLTQALPMTLGAHEDATASGVVQRSFTMPTAASDFVSGTMLIVESALVCIDPATNVMSRLLMGQTRQRVDNLGSLGATLAIVQFPTALTHAAGESATVRAVLHGGASRGPSFAAPTMADEAQIYFERLAPGDSAWRILAQLGQTAANPSPYGGPNWMYWSLDFTAGPFASADTGSSYRARACYFRPGSPTQCVIGPVATLTVVQQALLPAFTAQPRSVLIQPGQTASFSAQVGGTPAPTLKWQTRASGEGPWTDVASNGSAASYTTPPVSLAHNGQQYRLLATNAAGSVASDIVTVSVNSTLVPPAIVTQPASLSVVRGSEALFAVNATGTEALSYQWFKGGTAITGANAPQLKIANTDDGHVGSYAVEVSNAAGRVNSVAAQLVVSAAVPVVVPPVIVTQPAAVAVTEGNVATFGVGVNGSGPMSFQWRRNGADVAGATSAAYTLPAVTLADGGNYSVRVSNPAGAIVSQPATLAVTPTVTSAPAQAPTIVASQDSIVVAPGMDAMFGVEAHGSGPLTYRWLRNGVVVPGQDAAVYVINGASMMDAGSYQVEVSNSVGMVASSTSTVMLLGAPVLTAQPAAATVEEGLLATFHVTATGDALRYQWLRNGVAIPGANDTEYSTPFLTPADSGAVYSVAVYNGAGIVFSSGAVVTVTPVIVAPPADGWTRLSAGFNHSCAVGADGAAACWGGNANGQLGNGTTTASSVAVLWSLPEPVLQIATGGASTCALTATTGRVFCSGFVAGSALVPTELAGFSGVRQLALGALHACLIAGDRTVHCWGQNNQMELGDGTTTGSFVPVQVLRNTGQPLQNVGAIESTDRHTCALLAEGHVACWGATGNARLGWPDGTVPPGMAGTVPGLSGVVQLAPGAAHTCVRMAGGTVRCWGDNSLGQQGIGSVGSLPAPVTVPTEVPGLADVASLAAGVRHNCALFAGGTLSCWGTGPVAGLLQTTPVVVAGLDAVIAVAGGDNHGCVLRHNGGVRCWGANASGQLGTGDTNPRSTPTDTAAGPVYWHP